MVWIIEFDSDVEKDLRKIGHVAAKKVMKFLKNKVATASDPRSLGKPLSGTLSGFWRYRVGDYRLLAKIEDQRFCVFVVRIGHRKRVYRANN